MRKIFVALVIVLICGIQIANTVYAKQAEEIEVDIRQESQGLSGDIAYKDLRNSTEENLIVKDFSEFRDGIYYGPYFPSSIFELDWDKEVTLKGTFKFTAEQIMNGASEWWLRIPVDPETVYTTEYIGYPHQRDMRITIYDTLSKKNYSIDYSAYLENIYYGDYGIYIKPFFVVLSNVTYIIYVELHPLKNEKIRLFISQEQISADTEIILSGKSISFENYADLAWAFVFKRGLSGELFGIKFEFDQPKDLTFQQSITFNMTAGWYATIYMPFEAEWGNDPSVTITVETNYTAGLPNGTRGWFSFGMGNPDYGLIWIHKTDGIGTPVGMNVTIDNLLGDYIYISTGRGQIKGTTSGDEIICPDGVSEFQHMDSDDYATIPGNFSSSGTITLHIWIIFHNITKITFPCYLSYEGTQRLGPPSFDYVELPQKVYYATAGWFDWVGTKFRDWGTYANWQDEYFNEYVTDGAVQLTNFRILCSVDCTPYRVANVYPGKEYDLYDFGWGKFAYYGDSYLHLIIANKSFDFIGSLRDFLYRVGNWLYTSVASLPTLPDKIYGYIMAGLNRIYDTLKGIGEFIWNALMWLKDQIVKLIDTILDLLEPVIKWLLFIMVPIGTIFVAGAVGKMIYLREVMSDEDESN